MDKKFLKQYEVLYQKARTDFKVAKNILRDFEAGDIDLDLEVIMFHLQQSAEKLIKSLLDYNGIKYPYSHDLKTLINLSNDNSIIIPNGDKFVPLSVYAATGRYAVIHDDLDDIDKYVILINNLLEFVKSSIGIE